MIVLWMGQWPSRSRSAQCSLEEPFSRNITSTHLGSASDQQSSIIYSVMNGESLGSGGSPGARGDVGVPTVTGPNSRRRRRKLLWVIVGFLVVAPILLQTLRTLPQSGEYLPRRFRDVPGTEVGRIVQEGPVRVVVLDARRLRSSQVGLHLVISADGLESTEELVAQLGLSGVIEVVPISGPGGEPLPPPEMITTGRGEALEAWLAFGPGIERVSFDVAALLPTRVSGPVPPPLLPEGQPPAPPTGASAPPTGPRLCAVPVNQFGQCGLYQDEGRHLATVRLDLRALGIPAWIRAQPLQQGKGQCAELSVARLPPL